MRQMVSDIGEPAWVHRDVNCAAYGVVTVLCSAYGLIQRLAAEAAVYLDGLTEVLS